MDDLTPKEQKMLDIFMRKASLSSSALHAELTRLGHPISLVTIKRTLSALSTKGLLQLHGEGRSTAYRISARGRMATDVDAKTYCAMEPDKRYGQTSFNFDLFRLLPENPFSQAQCARFTKATRTYHDRSAHLSEAIRSRELERFIIELSWKSSKIEGNTYTLLDTEKLIRDHQEAVGHDPNEALMILNHKDAFQFLLEERHHYVTLTRMNMEELHRRLIKGFRVNPGLRHSPVGVTGSLYQPLGNRHQIQEAVDSLEKAVSRMESPYAKAFVALLGISYIQPFEDGNKRTARLMANAILLAHDAAPLSYRSVDENEYREAMLAFYELNTLLPIRTIFVAQYEFAATHYAVQSSSGNK